VYGCIRRFSTDIPIHNIPLLPTCLLQASQSFVEFNSLSLHPFTISTVRLPFRCSCYITFGVPDILRQNLTLSTNVITIERNNDAHSRCELPVYCFHPRPSTLSRFQLKKNETISIPPKALHSITICSHRKYIKLKWSIVISYLVVFFFIA